MLRGEYQTYVLKKSCICFSVEGFKYKGVVVVSECGDRYKILLGKNLLFCKLDSLVEELDEFIEKTSDYENRIERLLNV